MWHRRDFQIATIGSVGTPCAPRKPKPGGTGSPLHTEGYYMRLVDFVPLFKIYDFTRQLTP